MAIRFETETLSFWCCNFWNLKLYLDMHINLKSLKFCEWKSQKNQKTDMNQSLGIWKYLKKIKFLKSDQSNFMNKYMFKDKFFMNYSYSHNLFLSISLIICILCGIYWVCYYRLIICIKTDYVLSKFWILWKYVWVQKIHIYNI